LKALQTAQKPPGTLGPPGRNRSLLATAAVVALLAAVLAAMVPTDNAAATISPDPFPPAADPASVSGNSNFRTFCAFSHASYDDPIVHPNKPGAAHLHFFFGNTRTNAFSTPETLRSTGTSTCQGTAFNKSAYWMPAVLTADDAPVLPDRTDICYKHLTEVPAATVAPLPAGLKIVAGDASGAPEEYLSIAYWRCNSWPFNAAHPNSDTIPTCPVGDEIRMTVNFPGCWDGINLDSPDHQSHMAYAVYDGGGSAACPASHPVAVPEISMNFEWGVRDQPSAGWWLSSDRHHQSELPGGSTLHADWMNGWDQDVLELWNTHCIRQKRDCANGSLGNGEILDDMLALGSRRIPPIGEGVGRTPVETPQQCNGRPATIVGTAAGETINGTSGDDVIVGLGGNDTINGDGGFDIICGGLGNDTINGGPGNDEIWGGRGNDTVRGGAGDDFIRGNRDNDVLYGNEGNDTVRGNLGNDRLFGAEGTNLLHGGWGDDILTGGYWVEALVGGRGDDIIDGVEGPDRIWGGPGTDRCSPGAISGCEE
jgi:hypothetical protein